MELGASIPAVQRCHPTNYCSAARSEEHPSQSSKGRWSHLENSRDTKYNPHAPVPSTAAIPDNCEIKRMAAFHSCCACQWQWPRPGRGLQSPGLKAPSAEPLTFQSGLAKLLYPGAFAPLLTEPPESARSSASTRRHAGRPEPLRRRWTTGLLHWPAA